MSYFMLLKDSFKLKIGLVLLMVILLVISSWFPVPEGMGEKGITAVFIIILGIMLWTTNIVPSAITAMIIIILFSGFNIMTFAEAASNLGREIIWLLISMLIMSHAVEKTALHKRIAYNMFLLAQGNIRSILLILILFLFMMTFFIPNILGRIMLIVPICIGLINSLEKQNIPDLGKIIIPTITFVPVISAFSIITGSGGTLYAADIFNSILGYHWGYLEWLKVMMPLGLVTVIIYWFVVTFILFPKKTGVNAGMDYIYEEKKKLGKITREEITIIIIYVILLTLWLTKEIHGFSLAMSAITMVSTLFLPGIKIISWKEAKQAVEWGIPFIFAAGFSIAQALNNTEVTNWFSIQASKYLNHFSTFLTVIILFAALIIIRLGFVNNTMMIATVIPIIFSFASGTSINPLWLGMLCLIASFVCFMLPMQTISNITTYSMGYHTFKDHLLLGSVLTIILVVVAILGAFYYWPLIGLEVY